MIVKVYSYRDVQVGAFQKPFYDTNDKDVLRAIIARMVSGMNQEDIDKSHAKDLELYYLGTFDDETGVILSKPEFLLRLADYVKEVDVHADDKSVQSGSEQEA